MEPHLGTSRLSQVLLDKGVRRHSLVLELLVKQCCAELILDVADVPLLAGV